MSHPDPMMDYYDDYHGESHEDHYEDGWDVDDYYASDVMDGDHDSAMKSAGWGMDEDYRDDIDAYHDYYGDDI